MNNIINIFKSVFGSLLTYYHSDSQQIDPIKVNKAKTLSRAAIIVIAITKDKGNSITDLKSAIRWIKTNLNGECIFVEWFNHLDDNEKRILNISSSDVPLLNVSLIYETLLSIDSNEFDIKEGKTYRNQLGSYYSPEDFVCYLTKATIDHFVLTNGYKKLLSAKLVDFSCGAGIFLLTGLKYMISFFKEYAPNEKSEYIRLLACNLYACDVDCIALEIAKFSIMEYVGDYQLYHVLNSHFMFGNFLIHTSSSNSYLKEDAYLSGFVYDKRLAIDTNFLQEYDIILGNPPWEKIRFEEKSFYSQYSQKLSSIYFKFNLGKMIDRSTTSNSYLEEYANEYKKGIYNCKNQIKNNQYFEYSNCGELNTSTLFSDACFNQRSTKGVVGIIIKSSSITSTVNKGFFNKIKNNIIAVYDFINREKHFKIDSRERYCFLIIGTSDRKDFRLGMNLCNIDDIEKKSITISNEDLALLNPDTKMIPNISSLTDFNIVLSIYRNYRTIDKQFHDIKFGRIVHYTNHVAFLDKESNDDNIPVYEGKFFSSFDGCHSGYNDVPIEQRYKNKAMTIKLSIENKRIGVKPLSRFFIKKDKWESLSKRYNSEFMLAWHSLTSASNGRACIATILPFIPASQSVQFLITKHKDELIFLSCLFNSTIFDYLVKKKLNGIDLTQSIIRQLPVPELIESYNTFIEGETIFDCMLSICHSFLSTDDRLANLWDDKKTIKSLTNDRDLLFVRLDILVSKLYNLDMNTALYIISGYTSLYNSDTIKYFRSNYQKL